MDDRCDQEIAGSRDEAFQKIRGNKTGSWKWKANFWKGGKLSEFTLWKIAAWIRAQKQGWMDSRSSQKITRI